MSEGAQWPEMVETEWDEEGVGVAGTYPIATVHIGGFGAHNEPFASIHAAGCAYCNRWAVSFFTGQRVVSDGGLFKSVERRREITLIYHCDQHEQDAADELLEIYGFATNSLDLELLDEVKRHQRMLREETRRCNGHDETAPDPEVEGGCSR